MKPNLLVLNKFLRSKDLPFPSGNYSVIYIKYKMNKFIASAIHNTKFKVYIIDPKYISELLTIYKIHCHSLLKIRGAVSYTNTIYKQTLPLRHFWEFEKKAKKNRLIKYPLANKIVSMVDKILDKISQKIILKDYVNLTKEIRSKLETLDEYDHAGLSKYLSYGVISAAKLYTIVDDSPLKNKLLYRDYCYCAFRFYNNRLFNLKNRDNSNFIKWKNGTTGNALIDSCMREFRITKHLSDIRRGIVAAFWLNEYNGDWKVGEEYLREEDYDEAISKVNWWYLAKMLGPITKKYNPEELAKHNKTLIYQNMSYNYAVN